MSVSFSYADRTLRLPHKRQIKSFVASLFQSENKVFSHVNYVFCSDDFLLDINQRFLQHDYYTDIITFNLSEPGSNLLSGEIYISVDRVAENAVLAHTGFQNEALRVIFHGALHLCGYLDKKKSEIELMRYKEEHYLRLYSNL